MRTNSFLLLLVFGLVFFEGVNAQDENCPCCTEQHKAFDFWIGEWEVYNPDGTRAGYNRIEKIQGQCVLQENWTSARAGYTGTSYNYYNQNEERWEQLWVDSAGAQLKLYGNPAGNQMILSSEPFTRPDGEEYVNRITWTANADGTVQQLWEVLRGEEVVQVAFNGRYKKVLEEKE